MQQLTISNQAISTHNDLYSLTDLHKASGGENKHKPNYFLANQETQALIAEIESENLIAYHTVIGKGKKQGTYACRELVYRYAMWISAKFSLMVIRAFDALTGGEAIPVVQSDKVDRLPLKNAVNLLVAKSNLMYDEAYRMVHQYMGVNGIDEIPLADLPKAVEYVHRLILDGHQPIISTNENLINNAQRLAWHTQFIYSWYKAIEEPFRMLSPSLSGQIHDHIIYAQNSANSLAKIVGYGGMDEQIPKKKVWKVGFH